MRNLFIKIFALMIAGSMTTVAFAITTEMSDASSAPQTMPYHANQQTMLRMVPPADTPVSPPAQAAFNNMLTQNMPLSPQQIVRLHQQVDLAQRAASTPPTVPPKPV